MRTPGPWRRRRKIANDTGKPNGYKFHRALRKLADMVGETLPRDIIVIGDTMETDVRGAIETGLQSYLVLSGATTLEALAEYVHQPTRVLNSVADLIEELESPEFPRWAV